MVQVKFWIPKLPLKKNFIKFCDISPDIIFAMMHSLVGSICIGYVLYSSGLKSEAFIKKYRMHNIVLRPDDPRVQQIKHVSGLDIKE